MAQNKVYQQKGGVIGGNFKVYKTVVDATDGLAVGDFTTDLEIPKNSCVLYSFIANEANDLASGGSATLRLKVGSTALGEAAETLADVKGTIVVEEANSVTSAKSKVALTIGTAALTAGVVEIGVVTLTV